MPAALRQNNNVCSFFGGGEVSSSSAVAAVASLVQSIVPCQPAVTTYYVYDSAESIKSILLDGESGSGENELPRWILSTWPLEIYIFYPPCSSTCLE